MLEHPMDVCDTFIRNINVGRRGAVPCSNTIMRWVNNLRRTGNIMKKKSPYPHRSVRTPDNIELAREAFNTNPSRSTRKYANEVNMNRESENFAKGFKISPI